MIKNLFKLGLVAIDVNQSIAAGQNVSGKIPCLGRRFLTGIIYAATQDLTVEINQGVVDTTGTLVTRNTTSYTVTAGNSVKFESKLCGKFVEVKIANGTGSATNCEAYAEAK